MAPSMQISATAVTTYEDLIAGTKRASLVFTDANAITLTSGESNPIRLTNLSTPTQLTDAVNKNYVDNAMLGLKMKEPVRVMAFTAGNLATDFANGSVVDGVVLATGNRILLAAQTNAIENGLYLVAASGAPSRTTDMPAGYASSGVYVFIDEGTVYKDRAFICVTDRSSDIAGTNTLEFVQFSSRPSAMAGQGLVVGTANQLDVNVDAVSLIVETDIVKIKDAGVTNVKIATNTITNDRLVNSKVTLTSVRGLTNPGDILLGGTAYIGPDFGVLPDLQNNNTFSGPINTFTGEFRVTNTTASTSTTTGALIVAGGTGIAQNLNVGGTAKVAGNTTLQGTLAVTGAVAAGASLAVAGTTASTSASSGALTVAGGAGIAENLNVGGAAAVTGNATVGGALAVTGNIAAGAALTVASTDQSTDSVSGALRVAGGAGVAKNLYVGGNTGVTGTLAVGGNTTLAAALAVTGAVTAQSTLLVNSDAQSTSVTTGALVVAGGVGMAKNLNVGGTASVAGNTALGGTLAVTGTAAVNSTAAATSQTTGALTVAGGLGVQGDLYVSNTYNMSDRNLKDEITLLPDALETVKHMNGYSFRWRNVIPNTQRVGQLAVGVVAQEVQAVAPLCVSETDQGYLAVDYTKIVPYLIESCKTLSAQLEELRAEVRGAKRGLHDDVVTDEAKRQRV